MRISVAWKRENVRNRPNVRMIAMGFLTDAHHMASSGHPVIVDMQDQYVPPQDIPQGMDVDVYLDEPLTDCSRRLILDGLDAGYPLVARDNTRWPPPKVSVTLRIAPGTGV